MKFKKSHYSKPTQRYVKKYTTKQFKGFSPEIQQELTNKYTVILTDYKTRDEKIKILKGKIRKGLSNIGTEPKGKKRKSYLDIPISIKQPDPLGSFAGRKSKSYFDNLANF